MAVRCIAFHEKASSGKMKFISSLLGRRFGGGGWDRASMRTQCDRSMFRSKLTTKSGTLPSGYRSRFSASSDASQSFRIVGPLFFRQAQARRREGLIGTLTLPQAQQQDRQLSRHCHRGPLLGPRCALGRQRQSILAQGALGAEGTEDILRGTDQEPAQIRVPTLGDAQLRVALPALVASWAQAHVG